MDVDGPVPGQGSRTVDVGASTGSLALGSLGLGALAIGGLIRAAQSGLVALPAGRVLPAGLVLPVFPGITWGSLYPVAAPTTTASQAPGPIAPNGRG